jgi:DNA topoisomerase-2
MTELIQKKNKNQSVKSQAIRDNMILFIKCTVINPAFDSQSKETLTTPATKFGSKAEVSDKFIEKLYKSGMAEKIMEICAIHEEKTLKKTDGKKRDVIRGLPKLEDAKSVCLS